MAAHLLKLVQSSTDKFDFQASAVNVTSIFSPAVFVHEAQTVESDLVINVHGTSAANLYDNLITLWRVLEDAAFNYTQWQMGNAYTPIFLQWKDARLSTILQTEVFGGDREKFENMLSGALRANLVPALPLKIKHRPYWEETAQSLISAQSTSNNGGYQEISSIRGDVPAPIQVTVQAGTTSQDRVIIGIKAKGTVGNFVNKYEAESATAYGSGTATAGFSDANFSGGDGAQWSGTGISERRICLWRITSNVSDQMGSYRVYVRCRDLKATYNTKIRVRGGIYDSTTDNYQWGDYGDTAKYLDGTGEAGDANASSGGTTAIALVDCGIIDLPPVDTGGVAPTALAIELRGEKVTGDTGNEFDVDCIYLMPCYELPMNRGLQIVTLPFNLGNGADPAVVVDANDRVPNGYMTVSGSLSYGAEELRGGKLLGWTNKTMRVYILTQNTSNMRHTQGVNNTVTITATPRYRFGRGT